MSLSAIYAEYLNNQKTHKDRDPKRLFLTDLGKCHRQIAYRMLETEQDPRSEQQDINSTIMFDLAEHIEDVLIEALGDDVLTYQEDAPITDVTPEHVNWGGRCDILAEYNGRRVIEVKSVYPSSFKPDLPTKHHYYHLQAMAYDIYFREKYQLYASPLLAYFDRGGTNTPIEVEVTLSDDDVLKEMVLLENVRDNLPHLPPKLPKVIEVRSWGKELKLEPDSACRQPYCKYTLECKPDTRTSCLAKREKDGDPWVATKAGRSHSNLLLDYAFTQTEKIMEDF